MISSHCHFPTRSRISTSRQTSRTNWSARNQRTAKAHRKTPTHDEPLQSQPQSKVRSRLSNESLWSQSQARAASSRSEREGAWAPSQVRQQALLRRPLSADESKNRAAISQVVTDMRSEIPKLNNYRRVWITMGIIRHCPRWRTPERDPAECYYIVRSKNYYRKTVNPFDRSCLLFSGALSIYVR